MKTSWNAKVKTFLQMAFIVYCLVLLWMTYNASPTHAQSAHDLLMSQWTYGAMLAITILTIATAIEYLVSYRSIFTSSND